MWVPVYSDRRSLLFTRPISGGTETEKNEKERDPRWSGQKRFKRGCVCGRGGGKLSLALRLFRCEDAHDSCVMRELLRDELDFWRNVSSSYNDRRASQRRYQNSLVVINVKVFTACTQRGTQNIIIAMRDTFFRTIWWFVERHDSKYSILLFVALTFS